MIDLARRFEADGVSAIVYTDISKDGMMQGCNVEGYRRAGQCHADSGDRLRRHPQSRRHPEAAGRPHPGIIGAITGRAIYEGTLDVAEAQALCDNFKA